MRATTTAPDPNRMESLIGLSEAVPLPVLARCHALFLDFDGTLAPIQDDPGTVSLPPGLDGVLDRLGGRLGGALAIITGRDIRDLSHRVPASLWRIGSHGLEVCAPGETPREHATAAPGGLMDALQAMAFQIPGVRLERKGQVLAMHHRAAPLAGGRLLDGMNALVAGYPGYKIQPGKMVIEAKPVAANKGRALAARMAEPPFAGCRPVMVGDDTTDEDAFAEALALGGDAIKVGAGESLAHLRLESPGAVADWLSAAIERS